jgi:hypothetical protein
MDAIHGGTARLQREMSSDRSTREMPTIQLSATPKGNGYQATVTFPDGVSINSAETYPTIGEAIAAAAMKLLDMPERLARLDQTGG